MKKKRFFLFKSPTFFSSSVSCCSSVRETQCVRVRWSEPEFVREEGKNWNWRKVEIYSEKKKKLFSMDFFCFHCIYSTFGKAHRIAIYSKHGPTMCASAVRQRESEREFCVRKLQNKPNMKWRLIARKISYKLNLCNFHLFSKVSKSFAHHSSETKPLQNYFRIIFSSHLRMHAGEPSRMKFSEFQSEIWGGKEKVC